MSRRSLGCWIVGWVMLVGCGSDSFESLPETAGAGGAVDGGSDADGGGGGTGGAGGTGGTAGVGAAAGAAGSAGAAGQGGAAGEAGAAGDSGQAGQGGSAGPAGAAGGPQDAGPDAPLCPDPLHEPNESEPEAASLGDVEVCQSKTVAGIAAFTDADWYRFEGKDKLLSACTPTPTASVDVDDLRVCVFAQCKSGSTSLVCAQGLSATSPAGRQGCCATGGPVELTLACSGTNKDATVYVRVDQPGASSCSSYQLQYGY